jgi:hypothetical protein
MKHAPPQLYVVADGVLQVRVVEESMYVLGLVWWLRGGRKQMAGNVAGNAAGNVAGNAEGNVAGNAEGSRWQETWKEMW